MLMGVNSPTYVAWVSHRDPPWIFQHDSYPIVVHPCMSHGSFRVFSSPGCGMYIYIYTHLSNGNFYIPLKWQLLYTSQMATSMGQWWFIMKFRFGFPLEFQKNPSMNPANDDFGFQKPNSLQSWCLSGGHSRAKFHPLHIFHISPLYPQYIIHYTIGLICPSIPFSRYSLFYIQYNVIDLYIYIYIHVYSYDIHTLSALSWLCFIPHFCRWIPIYTPMSTFTSVWFSPTMNVDHFILGKNLLSTFFCLFTPR